MSVAKSQSVFWKVDGPGASVIVLLALIWWGVGIQPLMDARAARDQSLQNLATKREELRGREDDLRKGESRMIRTKQELERSAFRLGKASEMNSRIDRITQLAQSAGLRVDAIKPGDPVAGSRYTAVPIKLSGVGTYQTSVAFLHALRDRFPDVGLMSFDLRARPEPTAVKASYSFDLVWFTEPPPRPRGKTAKGS